MEVAPFVIDVPEAALQDLRDRLARTRWLTPIDGAGAAYGMETQTLRALAGYWREGFDWRAQERALARFEHSMATVAGEQVHFMRERGSGSDPLPILISHGWPGSFLEMLEIVPRLAHPERYGGSVDDAFDVVVPSLPGYGFSPGSTRPGMGPGRMAEILRALMAGLGYRRFGVQGGDWGASVSTWAALQAPEAVVGVHLNYIPGSYRPHLGDGTPPVTDEERAFLLDADRWYETDGAYAHLQATRPDTLGPALLDSPVGLLAWIVEKLRDWSDCNGDVESRFTKDEVLAHVTLYWLTGCIASANRLYLEARKAPLRLVEGQRVRVPCGIARFPREAPFPPRSWVERGYRVERWTEMPKGGHFAAMEEPELLARDIALFFRLLR